MLAIYEAKNGDIAKHTHIMRPDDTRYSRCGKWVGEGMWIGVTTETMKRPLCKDCKYLRDG